MTRRALAATRAARLYVLLTGGVVLFQLAVAAGAPWGHLTQGGAYPGVLPPMRRGIAVASALLLAIAAYVVGVRGGLWGSARRRAGAGKGAWVVFAYLCLGVVMNAVTPSGAERALWLPVTVAMAWAAFAVARAGFRG